MVKVGASTPEPNWVPLEITAPAAVGSPNGSSPYPNWFVWNAGKIAALQSPPPFWAGEPVVVAPEHVNALGEVTGYASCCVAQSLFRWSPTGIPTGLRPWGPENKVAIRTAALNDSGTAPVQTHSRDGLTVGGYLVYRDGTHRNLNSAPLGG
jgi:hypothetical protein